MINIKVDVVGENSEDVVGVVESLADLNLKIGICRVLLESAVPIGGMTESYEAALRADIYEVVNDKLGQLVKKL